jgi:hypothetical protein
MVTGRAIRRIVVEPIRHVAPLPVDVRPQIVPQPVKKITVAT